VAREQGQQIQADHAQQQQLSRLRYEAELAQRQFKRVDPENRLVAAELEQRWEAALRALKQAEELHASNAPQRCWRHLRPNCRRSLGRSVNICHSYRARAGVTSRIRRPCSHSDRQSGAAAQRTR
jgi:hypothetical protein